MDIQSSIEAGEFRSDLYYRLNVHRIHLPPLRERGEDVQLLIEQFLARYGGGVITGCIRPAWDALLTYPYPGNVRELQHVIQRAVAVARGPHIEPEDLPEEIIALRSAAPAPAPEGSVAAARERAEREMILATLARNTGEVSAAAREMQVSRTTMWRLMKKHGI